MLAELPRMTLPAPSAPRSIFRSRDEMLSWPAGRRDSDGVWGAVWYEAVERSTGFAAPDRPRAAPLTDDLQKIADQARPHYEALSRWKLS